MPRYTAQEREHRQYIRHLKRELRREKRVGIKVLIHHQICQTQEKIIEINRK